MRSISVTSIASAVAAPVVVLVVWALTGLPDWLGVILTLPALLVAVKIFRGMRRTEPWHLPVAVAESGLETEKIVGVSLPSASSDTRFLFSATVNWLHAHSRQIEHAAPGTLAADAILVRARAATEDRRPEDATIIQHRLAALLGAAEPDGSGQVVAWASDISLALPEHEQRHLAGMSELRKKMELWELEVGRERKVREYLREDVLRTPGSAVVWWLARNQKDVEKAVDLSGVLAKLAALAADEPLSSEAEAEPSTASIESVIEAADETARPYFAAEIAQLCDEIGSHQSAAQIRTRYDLEQPTAPVLDISRPPG